MLKNSKSRKRSGAATVEFVIVIPIVLIFILGLLEWGRLEMVRQVMSSASFNAARTGTLPGASEADVAQTATNFLDIYFVTGATVTSTISPTECTVHISVPYSQNSFVLGKFFGDSTIEREFKLVPR